MEGNDVIVLSDEDKEEILDNCFNTDWFCERMNESIEEYILDNYDNEDYYKKEENVEE